MSDPFGGLPFFGDLSRMLGNQGPVAWDPAAQLALSIAGGGAAEPNVDPLERIRLEELARVAEVQLSGFGLDTAPGGKVAVVEPVTRTQWVQQALTDFKTRFEAIAHAIGPAPQAPPTAPGATSSTASDRPAPRPEPTEPLDPAFIGLEDLAGLGAELDAEADQPGQPSPEDPDQLEAAGAEWLSGLMQMLSPMLLGMTAGSLIGHLATRSFGTYDIPLPRHGNRLLLVPATIDAFGRDWSLDLDELRLWLCLHELAHHAILGQPHVGAELDRLVTAYASGFRPDPDSLERHLADLDPTGLESMAGFQQILGDPETILGAATSPEQQALRARIDVLVATVVGYVDTVMDHLGVRLISSYDRVTEAVRRRRVESTEADRYVDRLFGLNLSQDLYDKGSAFCDGVVERSGRPALDRLWDSAETLPTPAELEAPGLWLARLDLAD